MKTQNGEWGTCPGGKDSKKAVPIRLPVRRQVGRGTGKLLSEDVVWSLGQSPRQLAFQRDKRHQLWTRGEESLP